VAVDHFGQVTVFDPAGRVACVLLASRHVQAWLPDGTHWSEADGPNSPATAAIGAALAAAWGQQRSAAP
jgi:hypothetical protein